MTKTQKSKKELSQSTAQQLGSIIKSCRDIMRKDKGLNGDLDRLPMLTWIMFLKFLDDLEEIRREEAELAGKRFRSAIDAPYRWRDWAANPQAMTGPELIAFVNQDEAVRPDGKRGDGLFARIKEELLKEFNLHTIVRLPNGVFAPYTGIPTNLLFFDRSGSTKEIWYYEQPMPEGRKTYTKTNPLRFEEFGACLTWWKRREENERAWKVKVEDLIKYDDQGSLVSVNLDRKNPRAKQDTTHLPPEQLTDSIWRKEQRIAEILVNVKELLAKKNEPLD